MPNSLEVRESFRLLVVATLVTLALWFIPFAGVVTYPIRLFVTFVHEAGHALAAVLTFGGVAGIEINWDGSGLARTTGGWRLLISSAGYLGAIIYGSALLLMLRRARHSRILALATAALLFLITIFFGASPLTWIAGLLMAGTLVLVGLKASPKFTHFFMSFLAVQCVLNAIYDLRSLAYISAFEPGRLTDAQNMAAATGGLIPPIVWAIGWSAASLAILTLTLIVYYRSLKRLPALPDARFEPLKLESPDLKMYRR